MHFSRHLMMGLYYTLKDLGKKAETKYHYLVISFFLALFSTWFEALSVGLLAPFLEYLVKGNHESLPGIFEKVATWGIFSESQFLLMIAILIVGSVIMKNALIYSSQLLMNYTTGLMDHNLRTKMVSRMLNSDFMFFMQPVGKLTFNVGTGSAYVTVIRQLYGFANTFFQIGSYLVVLFYLSPILSLFVVFLAPIVYFIIRFTIKHMQDFVNKDVQMGSRMSEVLSSLFLNSLLIKSYGTEKLEEQRYRELSDGYRNNGFQRAKITTLAPLIQEPLVISIVFLFGGLAVFFYLDAFKGGVAGFLTYFLILKRLEFMMNGFISQSTGMVMSLKRLGIFNRAYNEAGEKNKTGRKKYTGIKRNISFKNVSFTYKDSEVLSDVSFNVKRGKVVVIVGHTGSGKSTILLLLNRLLKPNKGKILVDGKDIWSYNKKSFRNQVAVVSQDSLALHLSIRENLLYGSPNQEKDEELYDVLKSVGLYNKIMSLPKGLDSILDEHGKNFSGGQKQKLSLARAMVHQGDIVLLDEATSALDLKAEKLVDQKVTQVFKGKTIFIVDHRLTFASQADMILVMEDGKIIEQGSFKELSKKKGKFWSYWQLRR